MANFLITVILPEQRQITDVTCDWSEIFDNSYCRQMLKAVWPKLGSSRVNWLFLRPQFRYVAIVNKLSELMWRKWRHAEIPKEIAVHIDKINAIRTWVVNAVKPQKKLFLGIEISILRAGNAFPGIFWVPRPLSMGFGAATSEKSYFSCNHKQS